MKIIDVLGNEIEFECMGCDIASHKMIPPGGYVYDDGLINISADPEIPIPGFMVLGIKKHVKSINDLSKEERYNIMDVLDLTIRKMKEIKICKEVLLVQEEKASHFHIWIVPIYEWMSKFNKNVRNIDKIINYSKNIKNENTKQEILDYVLKLKREFEKVEGEKND